MNLATILWSIFCGLVFTYYMLTSNGFVMLAWGGAFILSLLAVKAMLERESVASDTKRIKEIIEKVNEKVKNDPEILERKEELIRELSITQEDLDKVISQIKHNSRKGST